MNAPSKKEELLPQTVAFDDSPPAQLPTLRAATQALDPHIFAIVPDADTSQHPSPSMFA